MGLKAVNLMSLRWAQVAIREWSAGQLVDEHQNIMATENVLLHVDEDKRIQEMILNSVRDGTLPAVKGKTSWISHYICFIQEYMNRGTVQDWMDKDRLSASGMLSVAHALANALAYM